MDTNPYQIRFDLLNMANHLLMEQWYAKRNALEMEWNHKISCRERTGDNHVVPFPEIPSAPTVDEITELASALNSFVSRKS